MSDEPGFQIGFLVADFEHHLSVASPDGRVFQVSKGMTTLHADGIYVVHPEAQIEHVFEGLRQTSGTQVIIPREVLQRLNLEVAGR